MRVIKKDGSYEDFKEEKIVNAVTKSASRVMINLTEEQFHDIIESILSMIDERKLEDIPIADMHNMVELTLDKIDPKIAKSYRDYRDYKSDFVHIMDKVYEKSQSIRYLGDKDNGNTNSALVATKRCLIFNELNKRLYRRFFMTADEKQACRDGYIYIHDQSARLDTLNCFDRSTRFITENGVQSFYEFIDGDEIKVLTHKGNWKKGTVHAYGWQRLQKIYLKRANGSEHIILATPNHRWILKDGSETTNLKVGDKLVKTPCITQFNWDDLTRKEKKLWCLGFGFGDGSVVIDNDIPIMHIRLCGDKVRFASRFIDVGYSVTKPASLNGDLMVRMPDIHTKEIPLLELNYSNIKYYVNGFLSADGSRNNNENGSSEFKSIQITGEEANYQFNRLLNIAGYYITSSKDYTGEETNYGIRTKQTINYCFYEDCGDRTWFVTKIEEAKLNPRAQVWCLDVEDDHSFLLEGGIPTGNCQLFNMGAVLKDGFEMGNVWYNEPKSLDVAFDVMGDVILSTASQQYGGFTVSEVDKLLAPYAEKSYNTYYKEYEKIVQETTGKLPTYEKADEYALKKVRREYDQGWQGIEMKLNTVGSSRGDYPFITMTFGLGTSLFEKMCSISFLNVHKEGQGKKGHKRPVLFPKLVFLYDENIHGHGCINEDVFEAGVECSCASMYPDWLSLSGDGYVAFMYKKYGKVVSPMGCRAFLSPWYERGGMEPADDNDVPVFVGRFNMGVVSLNLPMILAKAKQENKDFYEVLDFYLEMIRGIHKRTYDYLGELRASVNPVCFCEGGVLGGHLQPRDKIKPLLKPMTASFGITALNELQMLYNKKSLVEDGQFALEVMKYINDKIKKYSKEDQILYAIYGTPAETLAGLQVEQFRKLYGIIEGVSDKEYVSNSFHCHVSEDITPIQKQDLEGRFWDYFNGGKIQYCRYPVKYNKEAARTLIRRAMQKGFYEGVNLELSYCNNCGYEELEMPDVCPKCGSKDIIGISRMNGYLSYSRINGDTRLNDSKMAEIHDRISM